MIKSCVFLFLITVSLFSCAENHHIENNSVQNFTILDAYSDTDISNQVKKIADLIRSNEFKGVDCFFQQLNKKKPYTKNGFSVSSDIYNKLSVLVDLESSLDKWCAAREPSYVAFLLRSNLYVVKGWRERGAYYANKVKAEQWKSFKHYLALSKTDLDRAYALNPDDPNICDSYLLLCRAMSCPIDEMEKWFQRSIKLDPMSVTPYAKKSEYLLPKWHGSWPETFQFADFCYRNAPAGSNVYMVMAYVIRDLINQIKTANWDYKNANERTIKQLMKMGVWIPYKTIHERYLQDFPESSSAMRGIAYIKKLEDNNQEALQWYNKVLELYPEDIKTLEKRGELYLYELEHYDKALIDIKKVVEHNPQNYKPYYALAIIYKNSRQHHKVIEYMSKAIAFNRSAQAYKWRGLAYIKSGQPEAAIKDYYASLELDSEDAHTHILLAVAHDRIGDQKKAIKILTAAAEKFPDRATIFSLLGSCKTKIGEHINAYWDYKKACELVPESKKAQRNFNNHVLLLQRKNIPLPQTGKEKK